MKHTKMAAALVVTMALSAWLPSSARADNWETASAASPAVGQVLWESTTSASPTIHYICVDITASVAATTLIQHRNAANSANIEEFRVPILANGMAHVCAGDGGFGTIDLDPNERLRIVNNALALGTVSISMQHLFY